MKKLLTLILMLLPMVAILTGCKSDKDKVRETVEAYLYKNMKNPESLKILSCEVRQDTVPFYLTKDILDLSSEYSKAAAEFIRYSKMGYLFIDEALEASKKFNEAKEKFEQHYQYAKDNDSDGIEYIAYVKSSGANSMGGTVSNSVIFIIDKNDPTKILGTFVIDEDFIKQFVSIKMLGDGYEFKTNKFGKYETEDLPYFEQFIMNDAE